MNQRIETLLRQALNGLLLLAALGSGTRVAAQGPAGLSEHDFLAEMPIVLSVSRLPQRLDETPGAVTLVDRDMIRRSGARDVADLLRLVPGFQSSMAFESLAPQASYHGGFDAFSSRMQVLVDGRSVYSPFFIGSIEAGLQTVALEDIDRIEVLRGSNSAAYGARAFLGVINIVTRDSADTIGAQARLGAGSSGIRDGGARIGWGTGGSTFRLSADRRADDGLLGSNGNVQVERVNFRADLRPSASDEIQMRAGSLAINAGKGLPANVDDMPRDSRYGTGYLQLDWRRAQDPDHDLALSYSHAEESYQDKFPYSLVPLGINGSIDIDATGRTSNDNLSLQQSWRQSSNLRLVWGGEWRREQVTSKALYNTDAALGTQFTRLFGNAEWRPAVDIVLNAGAMAENSSVNGASLAPRLMLNWHLADGQTLRVGGSRAYRPPSVFEKSADLRYFWNGQLLQVSILSSGKVKPESVVSTELGYLGLFPSIGLQLDLRVFHERIGDFIRQLRASGPKDYANIDNFRIQGLEYEMKWQPWAGAQLRLTQAFINSSIGATLTQDESGLVLAAPKLASTLAYFQKLPGGLQFSLMHQDSSTMTPQGAGYADQTAMIRTDLRLALPLRLDRRRAEMALVVQNLGAPYLDYAPAYAFQRRAFLTLQIEN
jgi:iron complex outermembrane receptor protein